jgi:uncharacterized protein (DUF433 family)
MDESTRRTLDQLSQPFYSFSDADYIADVSRGTSRRWIAGYRYRNSAGQLVARPPVIPAFELIDRDGVSFVDLVEIVAIGRLKAKGFGLRRIRDVVRLCQELLGVEHPLAVLQFKADGREIFVQRGAALLDVSHGKRKGLQAWDHILGPYLDTLDYDDEIVRRWWPLGRDIPIVVDPEYGFGYPVVAGSGVRTEIILERFRAGDLQEQIAKDFNLQPIEVERALQFEANRLAA